MAAASFDRSESSAMIKLHPDGRTPDNIPVYVLQVPVAVLLKGRSPWGGGGLGGGRQERDSRGKAASGSVTRWHPTRPPLVKPRCLPTPHTTNGIDAPPQLAEALVRGRRVIAIESNSSDRRAGK